MPQKKRTKHHPGQIAPRDANERAGQKEQDLRDAALDKTLADSFPTSDPPSTIPDPADDSTTGADDPGHTPSHRQL